MKTIADLAAVLNMNPEDFMRQGVRDGSLWYVRNGDDWYSVSALTGQRIAVGYTCGDCRRETSKRLLRFPELDART